MKRFRALGVIERLYSPITGVFTLSREEMKIQEMKKFSAILTAAIMAFFLLSFPQTTIALTVQIGQQVQLKAQNSLGIPLHEFPRPSLIDRVQNGEIVTVVKKERGTNWINIERSEQAAATQTTGWISQRYVDKVISIPITLPPTTDADTNIEDNRETIAAGGEIFPGLTGRDLQAQLDTRYSPNRTLGYGPARNLLYGQIDNKNGRLSGIYSGYTISLSPNVDSPKDEAFAKGINAEHVWPQGMGAKGSAKSDMHHLFPARIEVNGARSNFPFSEIPDDETRFWYLDDDRLSTKPTQNIDAYSEGQRNRFEPRERKKGDVARAMFYFQTVYPEKAGSSFFNTQKDTLCQWHTEDPADAEEIARSHAIANTAQGNENPFVLDSSLAARAYCD
ncbi:MAG: endonuclease [Cyanobacteria bacterium P01_D01_bin.105]